MDHVENFRTAIRNHVQKKNKVNNNCGNSTSSSSSPSCVTIDMTLLFLNIFGNADKETAKQIVEEELICSICLDLVIDARVTNCNHLFCSFCLERWFLETEIDQYYTDCPYCKRRILSHKRDLNVDGLVKTVMSKYDLAYKVWLRDEKRRRWIQMMELQKMRNGNFWKFCA